MARCSLTNKHWMNANKVSHSNIKTARKKNANVQKKRIFDPETGTYITLQISMRALKTFTKKGFAAFKNL